MLMSLRGSVQVFLFMGSQVGWGSDVTCSKKRYLSVWSHKDEEKNNQAGPCVCMVGSSCWKFWAVRTVGESNPEVQRILQSTLRISVFCVFGFSQSWNQSPAGTEGWYFSVAKAEGSREQENGGDAGRRGKSQDRRICGAEEFGFHQAVGTNRRILMTKRSVPVLGIKF